MLKNLSIILGGARSGKSGFAERLIAADGRARAYVATAQAFDAEMKLRIADHRADRGQDWETIEEPLALVGAMQGLEQRGFNGIILIDCLTLWLSNLLLAEQDLEENTSALLRYLAGATCPVVCVSNEVGMGLVPDNKLGRRFRDAQGRLNQQIAAQADLAVFVAAGLPLVLKGTLPEKFL